MSEITNDNTTILQGGVSVTTPPLEETALNTTVTEYYFDIITEHSLEMNNQITDNYVENNTAIQDHIAHNPLLITISGISGEKVYKYDPALAYQLLQEGRLQAAKMNTLHIDAFKTLAGLDNAPYVDKLSAIPVLYPPVSNYIQVAKNAAQLVDVAVTKYTNVWNSLTGKEDTEGRINLDGTERSNRLLKIFYNLKKIRDNNIPLTVSTPYQVESFDNMYIQSVRLSQGNQLYTTDIQMTLKQLRFSNVTTTAVDKDVMAKYNDYARAQAENNGVAQGNKSILKDWTDKAGITQSGSGIKN